MPAQGQIKYDILLRLKNFIRRLCVCVPNCVYREDAESSKNATTIKYAIKFVINIVGSCEIRRIYEAAKFSCARGVFVNYLSESLTFSKFWFEEI